MGHSALLLSFVSLLIDRICCTFGMTGYQICLILLPISPGLQWQQRHDSVWMENLLESAAFGKRAYFYLNTSESRQGGTNHYLPMMLLWRGGCVNASISPPFYPRFLINTHFKLVQCTVRAKSTLFTCRLNLLFLAEVIDLTYIKIHIINSTAPLSLIGNLHATTAWVKNISMKIRQSHLKSGFCGLLLHYKAFGHKSNIIAFDLRC